MLYAREQNIRRDKLLISSTEKRYLYNNLTLSNLSKVVRPDEIFDIHQIDEDESYYLIEIHKTRYETDEEQAERIARQERYNAKVLKFRESKQK